MLETILVIALVGLVVGFALRELGNGFGERQKNLETYTALPFP
jgi:type II secretory pathway pseudopilin PulG